jgi:hypothetical protein
MRTDTTMVRAARLLGAGFEAKRGALLAEHLFDDAILGGAAIEVDARLQLR